MDIYIIFKSCFCLLLLLEKANVLTVPQHCHCQMGIAELGVVHTKSTKITSSPAEMVFRKLTDKVRLREPATLYPVMCRSDSAARPQGEHRAHTVQTL